jgi:hypothetical protein
MDKLSVQAKNKSTRERIKFIWLSTELTGAMTNAFFLERRYESSLLRQPIRHYVFILWSETLPVRHSR